MRLRYILLFVTAFAFAQNQYPEDYFQSPLDIPVHPSGTFGELRSNHFHAGLDYRTNQKTGLPVHAAASGYVSRIKVSSYGYGTALYINHPNGYTTVYGHLSAYAPKIDDVVRAAQYRNQSFDIQLFFKPGEIPVEKGEVVALSGNTGGSGGPHLHFEYRDTKTSKIINPLHFGLRKLMKDNSAPNLYGLRIYPLTDETVINGGNEPVGVKYRRLNDGTYLANTIKVNGKVGLGINTADRSQGSTSRNGVYKIETYHNDEPNFNLTFDTFSFSETRYINNLIDYSYYRNNRQRYQKLFVQTPYSLSLVKANTSDGAIMVTPENNLQEYKIEVYDFHGNKTVVKGAIEYSDAPATKITPKHTTSYFVDASEDNSYAKDGISVYMPAGTFYEDFYMDFDVKDSVLYLHDDEIPVHKYFTVTFDASHLSPEVASKTFIEGFSGNRRNYHSSTFKNGKLTARVRSLGKFKLDQDTTPPKIYSPSFTEGKWLSTKDSFSLKISDDLSGIGTYNAWLNGKWILMHYDYKTRVIFHNFSDGIVDEGKNELKVVVTDNVGNSTTFETHFFRTQNNAPVENNK